MEILPFLLAPFPNRSSVMVPSVSKMIGFKPSPQMPK